MSETYSVTLTINIKSRAALLKAAQALGAFEGETALDDMTVYAAIHHLVDPANTDAVELLNSEVDFEVGDEDEAERDDEGRTAHV